ncbi:hypothetical protein [Rheinheimera sp.]|uniref:hypothetical protein n=1 Tax=Rheinheimera sp. TaxID=1869214 RepID=UPI00307F4F42
MKLKQTAAAAVAAISLAVTPVAQAVAETVDHHVAQLSQFSPTEVLLGYQKRWVADESPLKIAQKSRRTGITWAEACDAVLCASTRRQDGGCNHFYVGSNKEMAREFIEAAAMWARVFDKAGSEIQEEVFVDGGQDGKEILTFVVHFASGFKIQALSSNPSNLRGMQGNVTIDEAAFHERLAEVLKAALALTMWGSKVRLISTHNGIDNLFNQLITDSLAGKKRYSIHTITLDDACRDGLYQRICQTRRLEWSQAREDEWKAGLLKDTATEEDALEEYFCVPKAGAGIYLKRTLIERAMVKDHSIPIVRFTAPKDFELLSDAKRTELVSEWLENNVRFLLEQLPTDCRHVFGEDFARKGDLSVFVPLSIRPDLTKRVPFVVELSNATYEAQRQILMFILERLPRFTASAFDSTGNGGYLAETARLKFGTDMVDCVMLSQNWYREWMPKLKAEFDDGFIELPRHQDILDDLCKIQMKNGVPQIEKGSGKGTDGQQRHGDFAVALAMAIRASWMEGGAIEFTPVTALTQGKDSPSQFQTSQGCW